MGRRGRLIGRARAAVAAARRNARTLVLLGCVASNSIGAAIIAPAAGFFAVGFQGLAVLALEMKGMARGAG